MLQIPSSMFLRKGLLLISQYLPTQANNGQDLQDNLQPVLN